MTLRSPAPARLLPLAGTTLSLALCVTAPIAVYAQGAPATPEAAQPAARTGRIVGRVVDANTGAGVSDVQVRVEGTSLGTLSGVDGRFVITGVPAGPAAIQARRIGFQAKTITGVVVPAGRAVEQNVALGAATVQLQAVTVSAAVERGSVNQALDAQRTAVGVVNAVTSEQIARSPDGDAAQAVQRVSGVSVQDGRYVFVRGLGERYTTTSLNGARLPSPEPERKVVPLDLFPSGLLQTITTAKTFTPNLSGDFSGAHVDIRTREFPARRTLSYSMSTGYNTAASGDLPAAPGVGGEGLALARTQRFLPSIARAAGDLAGTSQGDKNNVINQFRNVWQADPRGGRANGSFSASLGGNDPVLGHGVGYLFSGTYSNALDVRANESRAVARAGDVSAGQPGQVQINRFDGQSGRTSVLMGGLANFGTLVGTRSRLAFNNTYNRTADNDARVERGVYEDLAIPVQIQRLDYVQRSVWSSQLTGEHDLGRQRIEWSGSLSGVTREQPDRSEIVYEVRPGAGTAGATGATGASQLLWLNTLPEGAVRTFAALSERGAEGKADYHLQLGTTERPLTVRAGGLGRRTSRSSDVRSYGIFARALSDSLRALPPEILFGGRFTTPESQMLSVRSLAQGGSYDASDVLGAGYAMVDAALGSHFQLVTGARVERSDVLVNALNTLGEPSRARREFTDALPSVALNFRPSALQNVRVSVARTLARPEYRELAGIRTREVLGGVDTRGNPNLVRTLIDNYDLRWELYPGAGEVLSVGVFAKRFQNPIERVFRPSNTNSIIEFTNARSAVDYGAELEARHGLGFLAPALTPLTAFTNLTLVRSDVVLGPGQEGIQNGNRPLTGQAPYVVNGGLTYTSAGGIGSATLLYNRVGRRLQAAGELPLPDVYELPRNVVDLSLLFPVGVRGVSARVDARNLLDARYVLRQGAVEREAFRTGRVVQVGLAWRP
jgi:hypothetical protein